MARKAPSTVLLLALSSISALLGTTNGAFAHAHLKSEIPAANSKGASPARLTLKFSEDLEIRFTTVKVTGADGKPAALGSPTLDPTDATSVIVPVTAALPPGTYRVEWHATATDTHKTQGTYSFTVAP